MVLKGSDYACTESADSSCNTNPENRRTESSTFKVTFSFIFIALFLYGNILETAGGPVEPKRFSNINPTNPNTHSYCRYMYSLEQQGENQVFVLMLWSSSQLFSLFLQWNFFCSQQHTQTSDLTSVSRSADDHKKRQNHNLDSAGFQTQSVKTPLRPTREEPNTWIWLVLVLSPVIL